MLTYTSKVLTFCLNNEGQFVSVVSDGDELLLSKTPFAQLAYYDPLPAFTNEWITPIHVEEPQYVYPVSAFGSSGGFTLEFSDGAHADFAVEIHDDAIIIELCSVYASGRQPESIRFACMTLRINHSTAVVGMALDSRTEGGTLPGIYRDQYALVYNKVGFRGRRWALTAAPISEMQQRLRDITAKYTHDVPWMTSAGAFASDCRAVQGSYMMTYGDYLPGSLCWRNVDEWIPILHSIGLTQVDFHGAEGKNFSFGDFEPYRPAYPEGRKSLKMTIDRLHEEGISALMHTYSSLIGPDSSLVTPIPDPRLGFNRCFTLTASIGVSDTALPIAESTDDVSLVHTGHFNSSTYVVFDDEIIQFTETGDHSLLKCIRGVFGTIPAPHAAGTRGRNLKRKYDILAPDNGGSLFMQVAKNTADCANECGFDGFYFDALEGTHVLEGRDLENYYCTQFIYEVIRRTGRPVGVEMSTMFHNLWYVRSRLGAWDRPSHAHKQYLERHAEVNRIAQACTFVPQNLGWWYFGENLPGAPTDWERITTDVYDTMGRLAAANDFSLTFQGLTVQAWNSSEEIRRYGDRVRRWEKLRLSASLSAEERNAIGTEECRMTPKGIFPVRYLSASAEFKNGKASVEFKNPYSAQTPFLFRFEPLQSHVSAPQDISRSLDVNDMLDPGGRSVAAKGCSLQNEARLFDGEFNPLVFTSRTVSANVNRENSVHGTTFRFRVSAQKNIGTARFERRYEEDLNIAGQYGCGVWIYGDGKGEILNLQLRCHLLFGNGIDEKLIRIDFVGWRYFELIETCASESMQLLWPYHHRQLDTDGEFIPVAYEAETSDWPDSMYLQNHLVTGNPHHLTAAPPDYSRIAFASVWMNAIPAGETCEVLIADWHTFFTGRRDVPDITTGNLRISGTLPADSIAEYSDGCGTPGLGEEGSETSSWFTSGPHSEPLDNVQISGKLPCLAEGLNKITLSANVPDGTRIRLVAGVQASDPLVTR